MPASFTHPHSCPLFLLSSLSTFLLITLTSHLRCSQADYIQMPVFTCQVPSNTTSESAYITSRVFLLTPGVYNFLRNCDGFTNCASGVCLNVDDPSCGACSPSYYSVPGSRELADMPSSQLISYVRVFFPAGERTNMQVARGEEACTVTPTVITATTNQNVTFNFTQSVSGYAMCGQTKCAQHTTCDHCLSRGGCAWCGASGTCMDKAQVCAYWHIWQ